MRQPVVTRPDFFLLSCKKNTRKVLQSKNINFFFCFEVLELFGACASVRPVEIATMIILLKRLLAKSFIFYRFS